MVCQPQFADSIPFECISKIVSDIRGNTIRLDTVNSVIWTLGSVIQSFEGGSDIMRMQGMEDCPCTADGIAARLEEVCSPNAMEASVGRWRPNPENVRALIDLLMKLLPIILPLIV